MTEWIISLNEKVIRRFNINEGWKLTIGRGAEADVIVDKYLQDDQQRLLSLLGKMLLFCCICG